MNLHMSDYMGINGRLPKTVLHPLSWDTRHHVLLDVVQDVQDSIEDLNVAYRERFGVNLTVNYSYRSWWRQVGVRLLYGDAAAPVGKSMHGLGLALDLGGGVQNSWSEEYHWMRRYAPAFKWDNPEWARPLGSNPEPWHWEYGLVTA